MKHDMMDKDKEKEDKGIYPTSGQLEDMEDLPEPDIKRHDGLPTVKDLRKLMGDEDEEGSEEKDLGKFIEVIIKIGK